jgi:hypothetical protein
MVFIDSSISEQCKIQKGLDRPLQVDFVYYNDRMRDFLIGELLEDNI